MFKEYAIALILLLAPFAAYAGGSVHHNTTNTVTNNSTKATGGSVESTDPVGQPGSISPAWTCSEAYSVSSLFFGFSWSSANEFCQIREQKREVCRDTPSGDRCKELKQAVADWRPATAGPIVHDAAE